MAPGSENRGGVQFSQQERIIMQQSKLKTVIAAVAMAGSGLLLAPGN